MYGDKFIHMIKVCYSNIQSKIKVNALLSDPFTLKRGIHQGYHLSMLPYIIAAEVLANFIIVDKRIKGIQIGNQEIKTVDFADDTTVSLRGISLLNRIQSIFKLRENVSSSKINVNKSQALQAGDYNNRFNTPGDMIWSNFSIKILGIKFGNFTLGNSIWDKIITKKISQKNQSLGQSQIILERQQTNYKPNFTFKTVVCKSYLYNPKIYQKRKEIEKRIHDFLWKRQKIHPHRYLIQLSIWKGGLGILDIDTQLNSLKIKWIKRLLHPTNALWKDLMLY